MTASRASRRDSGKSNVVPAIILAFAAVLAGKFASGGGTAAPAATTAAAAESGQSGEGTGEGTAATGDKIVEQPPATADEGAATTAKGGAATTVKGAATATTVKGGGAGTSVKPGPTTTTKPAAPHWTYDGEAGPVHWASLSPDYSACDGSAQSPIDVGNPKVDQLADVKFTYVNLAATVVNTGHTIQANVEAGSRIELDGKTYELVQLHVHSPSEHVVNGKSFPMEIHLVHKAADGTLAVVALMVKPGKENTHLAPMWKAMPAEDGAEDKSKGPIEFGLVLPTDHQTIRYAGSLTTPPCTEGVKWNIITTPIELSQAQIDAFTKLYKGNARPVENRKDRVVTMDIGADS